MNNFFKYFRIDIQVSTIGQLYGPQEANWAKYGKQFQIEFMLHKIQFNWTFIYWKEFA